MIWVSFQCNDPETGLAMRRVSAVTVHGATDQEFEGPKFPDFSSTFRYLGELPVHLQDRCNRCFAIGHHVFPCRGWKHGYGNWCWDATQMTGVDVQQLVSVLRELGYRMTAGDAALGAAYDAGEPIAAELMQEALR